jgi:hypothetical protein
MGERIIYTDDLDGTDVLDVNAVVRGVTITIETEGGEVHKGKKPLLLKRATYAALTELSDGDADAVREAFAPVTRHVRSKAEMDAIRAAARAAKNADGSQMFEEISDTGRLRQVVYTWYENEFLPEQDKAAAEAKAAEAKAGKAGK